MKLHKISGTEDLCTLGSVEEPEECQGYIAILPKQRILDLVFRTV